MFRYSRKHVRLWTILRPTQSRTIFNSIFLLVIRFSLRIEWCENTDTCNNCKNIDNYQCSALEKVFQVAV